MFSLVFNLLMIAFLSFVARPSWSLPSWDPGFDVSRPTASIGELVPGATFVEGIEGGVSQEKYKPKYLSISAPSKGEPGPAMLLQTPSPPLFYISGSQFWQPTNASYILRANILNVTGDAAHPAPPKLQFDNDAKGISGGTFRWRGTKLHYDFGARTNSGMYYSCKDQNGTVGVYTSLEPIPLPSGCNFLTLHSFQNRVDRP